MTLYLIELHQTPILDQLRLEEALVRADDRNFCLLNDGSPPAIVMKRTAVIEEMVDLDKVRERPIDLIRRFSGGGTVVVDQDTLFVTFICNQSFAGIPSFMDRIMKWSREVYRPVFEHLGFDLRENDYVIGNRKFGGSAQYVRKDRWCLHSSLLWDYQPENMKYLKLPPKRPEYRLDRSHDDFLCRLRDAYPTLEALRSALRRRITERFAAVPIAQEELEEVLQRPHHRTTKVVDF